MTQQKKIYLVGGAIRDKLLGLKPSDFDYVAVGFEEKDLEKLEKVGKDFPVFLDRDGWYVAHSGSEIALARTEKSTGPKSTDFKVNTKDVTLEEDLLRRDLTINAMAEDEETGEILDPLNGQKDLEKRTLRHCSDAFKDDPIRVLRLARLKAKLMPFKFKIAPETKVMIRDMKRKLIALGIERVWKEVEKAMKLPNPEDFFYTLHELGVLDVVFPNIYKMTLCREGSVYHQEASVFEHSMMVLKELKDQPIHLKLAAVYHDIAKPFTYEQYGNGAGHDDLELIEPRIDMFIPPKIKNKMMFIIKNHIRAFEIKNMKPSKVVNLIIESGKTDELANDLNTFMIADIDGRISISKKRYPFYDNELSTLHYLVMNVSPNRWIRQQEKRPEPIDIKNFVINERIKVVKTYMKEHP